MRVHVCVHIHTHANILSQMTYLVLFLRVNSLYNLRSLFYILQLYANHFYLLLYNQMMAINTAGTCSCWYCLRHMLCWRNICWFSLQDIRYKCFIKHLLLLAFTTHLRVLASSFLRFRDHTHWRTTVCRTPLEEGSARRRDLYLTTQHVQQTNIYAPSGIRTRYLSRRSSADPRLRPLGHRPYIHL